MKKKLLAILTSVLLLCAMLPLGAVGVSAATTGTTGDCTWTLDGTHLTISGEGAMGDYNYAPYYASSRAPWGTSITSITIEEGVTTIGNYVFYCCSNLTSVTIPNSVTSIGKCAFSDCENLTSMNIPDSVTSIGGSAFHYCRNLTSVAIPDSVTFIGDYAFDLCASLTSVAIPDGVTFIGRSAFHSCLNLTSVTIPNSVTTIRGEAFSYCENLPSVIIPSNVISIDVFAFYECTSLTDVYYDGSKSDKANIVIERDNTPLLNATWHYAADPISTTVTHSVMDTENGNGLAFRFELSAKGVAKKNGTEVDLSNATVNYLGQDCKLIEMGSVITNDESIANGNLTREQSNGQRVVDIPVVYVQEVTDTSCAFATRLINIPDDQLERTIYARPYYIVKVDGEEIVAYGDVDSASCAEYM